MNVNYAAQYHYQAAMQNAVSGNNTSLPAPSPAQQPNVQSGKLAVDNAYEVSTNNNIQSFGVCDTKKVDRLPKFESSRTPITFQAECTLGLYGHPQLKTVEQYNKYAANTAYKNS